MKLMILDPRRDPSYFFGGALGRLKRLEHDVVLQKPDDFKSIEAIGPDLVVTTNEIWEGRACCISEARRLKIPTLYVLDGILDWCHTFENATFQSGKIFLRPLYSDKIAVPGPSAARILASWGYGERAEIVGLPRVDADARGFERSPMDRPHLLVVTPNNWNQNPDRGKTVEAFLRDCKDFLEKQNTFQAIWRIQPELASTLGVTSALDTPLYQQLASAHAVVGPPTTVLLEAMSLGLPVACVDYQLRPPLTLFPWSIPHSAAIQGVLDELLSPTKERMAFQRYLLQDHLVTGGHSEDRLIELMVALMEEAQRSRAESRAPNLSRSVLPAPSNGPSYPWAGFERVGHEKDNQELLEQVSAQAMAEEAQRWKGNYQRLAGTFPVNLMLWIRRMFTGTA